MKKTIIVKVLGGLGNQMFQYAAARSLAASRDAEFEMDISGFDQYHLRKYELNQFNILNNIADEENLNGIRQLRSKLFNRALLKTTHSFKNKNLTYIKEKHLFCYDPRVSRMNNTILYLYGYWQHPDYFDHCRDILLTEFTFKKEPDEKNKTILGNIQTDNSVAIHVRRGDYISNPKAHHFHGSCDASYYSEAVSYVKKKFNNPVFFIFSDDPAWVKKHFNIGATSFICDVNPPNKGIEDFRLMKSCRHFIVANSSFSWWAAWLSVNKEKIVIAPKNWLKNQKTPCNNFIPSNWITI